MGPTDTPPPCPSIKRRVAFDKRQGHTTSEAAKDFIRRTCPCLECAIARKGARLARPQAPAAQRPAAPEDAPSGSAGLRK